MSHSPVRLASSVALYVLVIVAIVVSVERYADACSLASSISASATPTSGASSIPTNVEIRVGYSGPNLDEHQADLVDLILRPVGGNAVPLSTQFANGNVASAFEFVVARPTAELEPNTAYEVLSRLTVGCAPASDNCFGSEYTVLTMFTTGDGADQTPPQFAGATGFRQHWPNCSSDACCGPYTAAAFSLEWQNATDEFPQTIRYHVYRGDVRVAAYVREATGAQLCSGMTSSFADIGDFFGESDTYVVRAVDSAGNEDTNNNGIVVTISCDDDPSASPDAGPGASPDANNGGSNSNDDGSNGCSIGGSPQAPWLLSLLLLLAPVRRRRQRTIS